MTAREHPQPMVPLAGERKEERPAKERPSALPRQGYPSLSCRLCSPSGRHAALSRSSGHTRALKGIARGEALH